MGEVIAYVIIVFAGLTIFEGGTFLGGSQGGGRSRRSGGGRSRRGRGGYDDY